MIEALIIAAAIVLHAVITKPARPGQGYTPRSGASRPPERMPPGYGAGSLPVAWPAPRAPTPPGSQLIE